MTRELNIKDRVEAPGPFVRVSCQDRSELRWRRERVVELVDSISNRILLCPWCRGINCGGLPGYRSAPAMVSWGS